MCIWFSVEDMGYVEVMSYADDAVSKRYGVQAVQC